jgi:hypothetical protein
MAAARTAALLVIAFMSTHREISAIRSVRTMLLHHSCFYVNAVTCAVNNDNCPHSTGLPNSIELNAPPPPQLQGPGRLGVTPLVSHSGASSPPSEEADRPSFVDTEGWLGAEYTPAAAPANGLWW